MPANEVFVDTTALLAIVNRADYLHSAASKVHRQLSATGTPLVTTEWVLAEFLGGASRPPLRANAANIVTALRSSSRMTVIEATHVDWQRAFAFFVQHADKAWSFIDSSSMLVCRDRGIRQVFTYDHHFRQFGLEVLLRR